MKMRMRDLAVGLALIVGLAACDDSPTGLNGGGAPPAQYSAPCSAAMGSGRLVTNVWVDPYGSLSNFARRRARASTICGRGRGSTGD